MTEKTKKLLQYVGLVGAIVMSVAYVVTVCIIVYGFELKQNNRNTALFAGINALWGFLIMQFLKIQGQSFAENITENKVITEQFHKKAEVKLHSMTYYWVTSVAKDILTKALTFGISTFAIIYIVIQGSHDYTMFLLALVNLLMFISFGFLSLVKTYDYYNNIYINFLRRKLNDAENRGH